MCLVNKKSGQVINDSFIVDLEVYLLFNHLYGILKTVIRNNFIS